MRTHARAQGLRAAAARAAMPVAVALVLASAVTAGLVLHLPLPPSRRIATRIVTAQISRAMRGSIEIERISALSLRGVVARNVAILDPQGNVVLAAPEVHARGDLFAALLSGLPWSDHARLHITWVRAEHVDVKFRQDDTGTLTLATAFWAPPKPPSVPRVKLAVSRRPVTIDLSAIEVGTVAVRGRIGGYDGVHWDARGLLGSVHAGPDGSVVDVRPFPVMVREVTPRPVRAVVDYHFRSPELMWTSFVASMDDITVSGRAKLDGGYLDAVVDLPRTPPLAFALLLPETVRPTDPIEGRLAVRGTLPLLDTTAVVTSGDARVDAKGLLRLAPEIDADLALNVRQLDLSRVVVGGPATNLHADTVVRIGLDDAGAPTLRVTGRAQPTELLGVSLPESHIDAVVDRDGVRGKAMLQEPGMPVSADFSVSNNGRVDFVANANAPSLKHVPRLGGVVSGYAVTRVAGTYENGKLVGNAVADVGNVSAAGVRVGAGRVRARATASQRGVDVDASLSGSGLRAAGMTWGGVRATWRGSAQRAYMTLELTDDLAPRVSASARLHLGPRVAAHDVKVKLVQADREVLARTDIINLGGNTLDFGTLAVDGLGEPVNAVIRVGARGFDARVVSQGVDIDKLSRALGVALPAVDGQVAVDMDLRSIGAQTHGCVRLDVRGAKVPRPIWGIPVPDRVDASVRALFAGSTVDMDVNVSVGGERPAQQVQDRSIGACLPAEGVRGGGLFEARLAANATLHGPVTNPASWRGMTGTARLMRMMVDLDRLDAALLRPLRAAAGLTKVAGIPEIGGRFNAYGEIMRERSDAAAGWRLAASTQALRVAWGAKEKRRRVQGADLFLTAEVQDTGLLRSQMCIRDDMGAFDTELCDPRETNVLATLAMLAEFDYPRLWENPSAAPTLLEQAKIDGRLAVLDRPMANLIRPLPLDGGLPIDAERLSGEVHMRGTILDPWVGFRVQALDFGATDEAWRAPVTLCTRGQYDGTRVLAHAEIRQRRGKTPASSSLDALCGPHALQAQRGQARSRFRMTQLGYVDVDALARWADVLRLGVRNVPWVANVNAIVHGFELASVPAFADAGISGRVQAYGGIRGLGQQPQFDIMARMAKVRAGNDFVYDDGQIRVRANQGGLSGQLRLRARDEHDSLRPRLTLNVDTEQIRWRGLTPTRDGSKPVKVRLLADRFRIGMFGPVLHPVLNYVDGEVSGVARATWSPEDGQSKVHEMYLALYDGAFQVPTIGQEFLNVSGILQAAGSNRLYIEDFRAESLSGALTARATIDMQGFRIANVSAALKAERKRKIRLTFQGIPVGDVWGKAFFSIRPTDSRTHARVAFEDLHVDLSDTDLRTVQDLAPNHDIVVVPSLEATATARGQVQQPGEKAPVSAWYITLVTRGAAQLERSGMQITAIAPSQGSKVLQLVIPDPTTGETKLTGHLVLYDGRVDVFGKDFLLEEDEARVIFTGDPSDPSLDIRARWDAPDGTRVYVDVTGSIKHPRIALRSDPAKPPSEVLALVLFGTDAAGTGSSSDRAQGGEGTAAAGVGGGVATAGLNLLLEDLSPVNVSTRIDTSTGQAASPTLVVEVSHNVTAEASYVPPTDKTLDRDDQYLLTLDWRFLRSWSLRTTMGNKGSSIVDVIWQHRY